MREVLCRFLGGPVDQLELHLNTWCRKSVYFWKNNDVDSCYQPWDFTPHIISSCGLHGGGCWYWLSTLEDEDPVIYLFGGYDKVRKTG